MSVVIIDKSDAWLKRFDTALGNGLTQAAAVLEDTVVRSFGRDHGGRRSSPGNPPNSQNNRAGLADSFGHTRAAKEGGSWKCIVGSSVAYAKYLNNGATIRPKNTKMLMIPLTREAEMGAKRNGGVRGYLSSLGDTVKWVTLVKGRKYLVVKGKPKAGQQRSAVPTKPSGKTVHHSGHTGPGGRKIIDKGKALFLATVGPVRIDPRPWAKPAIVKAKEGMRLAILERVRKDMGGGA